MDLSHPAAEHAAQWCRQHVAPEPEGDRSLTWYVNASRIYDAYSRDAYISKLTALNFNQFYAVLRLLFKTLGTGRVDGKPAYTGIRYYADTDFQCPIFS